MTGKMRRFVAEYLVDFNGTQAAIRAGYSKSRAHSTADDLLKRDDVSQLIERGLRDKEKRAKVTADGVIVELAKIAFATREELESMAPSNKFGTTAKLGDKTKALEMLAKHFGLMLERHEHSGEVDGKVVLVRMPRNGREPDTDAGS